MKRGAVIRIILFSLTILILVSVLAVGIAGHLFSFNLGSILKTDYVSSVSGGNVGSGTVNAADVQNIKIEWVAGSITFVPGTGDKITFTEEEGLPELDQLRWKLENGTLTIAYCESKRGVQLGFNTVTAKKNLTLVIPAETELNRVHVTDVSADVEIRELSGNTLTLETVSGQLFMEQVSFRDVELDTVSGNLNYQGSAEKLRIESVSAVCTAVLDEAIRSIDLDTVSGDLNLTLPQSLTYSTDMDSLSSKIQGESSAVGTVGPCTIDVDAVSGKLTITRK